MARFFLNPTAFPNMSEALARRHVHSRSIRVEAFVREDGLWDIEAELVDLKARDFKLATGVRKVGEPVHDMVLVVTIDTKLNILAAHAATTWAPYTPYCETVTPDYGKLVGLNLGKDFHRRVRELLGSVRGCTHITELANVLPSAAVQAFANEAYFTRDTADPEHNTDENKPFQLDRCHALQSSGPAVAKFYPRWHRAGAAGHN
jgi:hypothetical protein